MHVVVVSNSGWKVYNEKTSKTMKQVRKNKIYSYLDCHFDWVAGLLTLYETRRDKCEFVYSQKIKHWWTYKVVFCIYTIWDYLPN